jgi:hypothetical protein
MHAESEMIKQQGHGQPSATHIAACLPFLLILCCSARFVALAASSGSSHDPDGLTQTPMPPYSPSSLFSWWFLHVAGGNIVGEVVYNGLGKRKKKSGRMGREWDGWMIDSDCSLA